jgi:hypothetical protein
MRRVASDRHDATPDQDRRLSRSARATDADEERAGSKGPAPIVPDEPKRLGVEREVPTRGAQRCLPGYPSQLNKRGIASVASNQARTIHVGIGSVPKEHDLAATNVSRVGA